MFLGPLEMSKPWDTNGIDGVHRFLRKLWNMYEEPSDGEATAEELRSLHKLIKKVTWDIENFSFNTSIPAYMIAVNELTAAKCSKRAVLEVISVLLAPFAPHIAEETWHRCGHDTTVCDAKWPKCDESLLVESTVNYPVQFNGKVKFTLSLDKSLSKEDVEKAVLADEQTQKQLAGNAPKRVIVVPGKIVNIVI
jgi:leucyl-tRNA synthetase